MLPFSVRSPVQVALLTAIYFAAAMIGLAFAIPPGNATAVWPTAGIALGGLVGAREASLAGDLAGRAAGQQHHRRIPDYGSSHRHGQHIGGDCGGLALPPVGPAADTPFERVEEAFLFATWPAWRRWWPQPWVPQVGLGRLRSRSQFLANWGTWWLGDLAGLMIVVPLVLAYAQRKRAHGSVCGGQSWQSCWS